jgi:hypothetical protein
MHLSSAVAEEIFTSHCWSVQPCVRPVSAAHRAAGDNALRGSVLPASGFRTCRRAGICDLLRRNDPGIESRAASTKLQTESVADLASLRSRLWDLLANGQAVRYPDASFGDPISVSRSFDVTLTSGQRGAFSAMRRISAAPLSRPWSARCDGIVHCARQEVRHYPLRRRAIDSGPFLSLVTGKPSSPNSRPPAEVTGDRWGLPWVTEVSALRQMP